jgi:class 3 adenylate cyclase
MGLQQDLMANEGYIRRWLAEHGFAKYAEAFASNDITLDVLPDLTDADLKDLGVGTMGDRKRLLRAIASLVPANAPVGPTATPPSATDAERRQITVLFCDLVGSTALASRLDAEDLRDVIRTYHKCCAKIVGKYDGSIAQYLGDGVMARFGYPKAHEDDADRAVRCGLDMVQAVAALKVPNENKFEVRIGIATGVVVVGDQASSEVGETPNLAARLQDLAQPGSIIIADSTKKLIGALFECRDMGTVTVKGYGDPIKAWQVLSLSQVGSRFEALRSHELTPLVAALGRVVRRRVDRGCGRNERGRVKFANRAQQLPAITEDDPEVLQVLISQVAKDREINAVLGKALGILGHAKLFEPVRNPLH